MLLGSVAALTVSSLLLGLAVITDVVAYWMLLVAGAIQAVAFAMYLPARIAFITELVEVEQVREAVMLSATAQEGVRVFAPALAGVMMGVEGFGTGGVFLVAAATSLWSGVVLFGLPPGNPRRKSDRSPLGRIGRWFGVRPPHAVARVDRRHDDLRRRRHLPVHDVPAGAGR